MLRTLLHNRYFQVQENADDRVSQLLALLQVSQEAARIGKHESEPIFIVQSVEICF